jgi:PST family polysaccharide transporter
LPLITLPYLVRVLGAEKFGLVAFAQAFIQYFVILTDYGFNLSATREISIHRENRAKVLEIFNSVMIIKGALTVASFGLLCGIVFGFGKFKLDWEVYLLTFGMVIGQTLFPVWFFQGMERVKHIAIVNITTKLVFTAMIFLVIRKASHYAYVPMLNSGGYILAGILGQWLAFSNFGIRSHLPSIKCLCSHFKNSTQFFFSRASVSIYTSSNAFFLGLFTNTATVGYYSAAEKLYLALRGIYQPLTTALYPYMAKCRNIALYKKIFKSSLVLNSVSCILLFVFSRQLVALLFGDDFHQSAVILTIFSAALFVAVPAVLLGYPFLAALDFARYANGSVIAGSLLHLGTLAIVSPFYINGCMVTALLVITETIVLFLRIYAVERHKLWRKEGT